MGAELHPIDLIVQDQGDRPDSMVIETQELDPETMSFSYKLSLGQAPTLILALDPDDSGKHMCPGITFPVPGQQVFCFHSSNISSVALSEMLRPSASFPGPRVGNHRATASTDSDTKQPEPTIWEGMPEPCITWL